MFPIRAGPSGSCTPPGYKALAIRPQQTRDSTSTTHGRVCPVRHLNRDPDRGQISKQRSNDCTQRHNQLSRISRPTCPRCPPSKSASHDSQEGVWSCHRAARYCVPRGVRLEQHLEQTQNAKRGSRGNLRVCRLHVENCRSFAKRLVCLSACLGSCHHNLDCDGGSKRIVDLYPSSLCGIWGIDIPADVGALSLQSALCTRGLQNSGTLRPQAILAATLKQQTSRATRAALMCP